MGMPYETASAGQNALREIERILANFDCQNFGTMQDNEKGCLIVVFKYHDRQVQMRASWKGYANAWMKRHPWKRGDRQEYETRAMEQAQKSVCSVLRDRIKGEVTAVECGIASFEEVFLSDLLLPSGERVMDRIVANKMLPPPPEEKVVGIKR